MLSKHIIRTILQDSITQKYPKYHVKKQAEQNFWSSIFIEFCLMFMNIENAKHFDICFCI